MRGRSPADAPANLRTERPAVRTLANPVVSPFVRWPAAKGADEPPEPAAPTAGGDAAVAPPEASPQSEPSGVPLTRGPAQSWPGEELAAGGSNGPVVTSARSSAASSPTTPSFTEPETKPGPPSDGYASASPLAGAMTPPVEAWGGGTTAGSRQRDAGSHSPTVVRGRGGVSSESSTTSGSTPGPACPVSKSEPIRTSLDSLRDHERPDSPRPSSGTPDDPAVPNPGPTGAPRRSTSGSCAARAAGRGVGEASDAAVPNPAPPHRSASGSLCAARAAGGGVGETSGAAVPNPAPDDSGQSDTPVPRHQSASGYWCVAGPEWERARAGLPERRLRRHVVTAVKTCLAARARAQALLHREGRWPSDCGDASAVLGAGAESVPDCELRPSPGNDPLACYVACVTLRSTPADAAPPYGCVVYSETLPAAARPQPARSPTASRPRPLPAGPPSPRSEPHSPGCAADAGGASPRGPETGENAAARPQPAHSPTSSGGNGPETGRTGSDAGKPAAARPQPARSPTSAPGCAHDADGTSPRRPLSGRSTPKAEENAPGSRPELSSADPEACGMDRQATAQPAAGAGGAVRARGIQGNEGASGGLTPESDAGLQGAGHPPPLLVEAPSRSAQPDRGSKPPAPAVETEPSAGPGAPNNCGAQNAAESSEGPASGTPGHGDTLPAGRDANLPSAGVGVGEPSPRQRERGRRKNDGPADGGSLVAMGCRMRGFWTPPAKDLQTRVLLAALDAMERASGGAGPWDFSTENGHLLWVGVCNFEGGVPGGGSMAFYIPHPFVLGEGRWGIPAPDTLFSACELLERANVLEPCTPCTNEMTPTTPLGLFPTASPPEAEATVTHHADGERGHSARAPPVDLLDPDSSRDGGGRRKQATSSHTVDDQAGGSTAPAADERRQQAPTPSHQVGRPAAAGAAGSTTPRGSVIPARMPCIPAATAPFELPAGDEGAETDPSKQTGALVTDYLLWLRGRRRVRLQNGARKVMGLPPKPAPQRYQIFGFRRPADCNSPRLPAYLVEDEPDATACQSLHVSVDLVYQHSGHQQQEEQELLPSRQDLIQSSGDSKLRHRWCQLLVCAANIVPIVLLLQIAVSSI
ncbi:hypothetical protein DIPPA_22960 [Diplonema papillatum]|nr:hypothetical protein DIPPA_22960 [Diplonema papillatum]